MKLDDVVTKLVESLVGVFNNNYSDLSVSASGLATRESAQYVIDHMNHLIPASTPLEVLDLAIKNISLPGLILEFGVYQGFTVNHIATLVDGSVHGFDSFEGLPETWYGPFQKGKFSIDTLPKVNSNVTLHKGWFDESIDKFLKDYTDSQSRIAFLHIDCDLYSSTKTVFEKLEALMTNGTIVVFDEYFNYPGWRNGEFKAFQEFIEQSQFDYEYLSYNKKSQQVAIRIL